jgi:hypothetical protein
MNYSEKLFEDETTLMNEETMKNLASFRKLVIPDNKSEKEYSDGELKVNVSFDTEEDTKKSSNIE